MSRQDHGPEVLRPAAEVRKLVEEHLESLPAWEREGSPEEDGSPETRGPALPLHPASTAEDP
jgi:hypothetical protein